MVLSSRQTLPRVATGVNRTVIPFAPARTHRTVARAAQRQQHEVECSSSKPSSSTQSRRALLGFAAAAAALAMRAPGARADPYLLSTGGKGPLAEEEARLLQLRKELEGEVRRELEAERAQLEKEARTSAVGFVALQI